jgi:hypothetical protein
MSWRGTSAGRRVEALSWLPGALVLAVPHQVGTWREKIELSYTLGTLRGGYALRNRETIRNVNSVLNPKKHGICEH